jgi:tellurite resistance protein
LPRASLRSLPLGIYGMVMGLVGLGVAWRSAGAGAWLSESWIALGVAAFALLAALHLVKLARHRDLVVAELKNPALLGFCGALPVALSLVAAGLAPHAAPLASLLWWAAYALHLAFMAGGVARWLAGMRLADLNTGWIILMVGGIVVPLGGLPLGHVQAATLLFAASVALAPLVMGLVLWRAASAPPLPVAARPTWFVLLAPPMLLYINGPAVWAPSAWIDAAYVAGMLLALWLLWTARRLRDWPFSMAWWSFTFPLDAVAGAAWRYADAHPAPLWRALAWAALALATAAVLLVGARTLAALRAGTLFAPPPKPRSGASPPA